MPSLFKKLLYGGELSNPYVNPYHVGHRASASPQSHSSTQNTYGAQNLINTGNGPSPQGAPQQTSAAQGPAARPSATQEEQSSRSPSPTMLEEARRLVGRDAVTGKRVVASGKAGKGVKVWSEVPKKVQPKQAQVQESNTQPGSGSGSGSRSESASGSSSRWRPSRAYVGGGSWSGSKKKEDEKKDWEYERRTWEEAERRQRSEREVGGYFQPERPAVREFYSGA